MENGMDLYSLLMENDEPTAAERAAGYAAGLRGQDIAAAMAQASGVKSLAPWAQATREQAQHGQDQLLGLAEHRQANQLAQLNAQRELAALQNQIGHQNQQTEFERQRLALERLKTLRDLDAKPVPEQEATKIVNQTQALPAIDKLEDLQKEVPTWEGALAEIPFIGFNVGAQARYEDAKKNLGSAIAAGAAPGARENAELMKHFEEGLPKGVHTADRAHAAFDKLREATKSNAQGQVKALQAGRYDPRQVQELQRQVDAAASARKVINGKAYVKVNGKWHEE